MKINYELFKEVLSDPVRRRAIFAALDANKTYGQSYSELKQKVAELKKQGS